MSDVTTAPSSTGSLTDGTLLKGLWMLCGATMALSSVSFYRLDVGNAHLDGPMFCVIAIVAWTIVMTLARGGRIKLQIERRALWYAVAPAAGLLLWHALALIWSPRSPIALREFIKIAAGFSVMFLAVGLMPRRGRTLEWFWTGAAWGGVPLFLAMMYQSFYVWHMPLLSTELDEQTFFGRNHLAGTVSYQVAFAAAYAWHAERRIYRYIPFAVIAVALLASGSRSGTAAMLMALIVIAVSRARIVGWWRSMRPLVVGLSVLAAAAAIFIYSSGFETDFLFRRFVYLWDPQAVPELHSYDTRSLRIRGGIDHFLESPVRGLGTGQLEAVMELPHNDYILVLADFGLVGASLLLLVLGNVAWRLFRRRRVPNPRWPFHASRGAFIAIVLFMNTMDRVYSTLGFWILMAMATVAAEPPPDPESHESSARQREPAR